MAATTHIGLQFPGNLNLNKKPVFKVGEISKVSFCSSYKTNTLNKKRRFLLLRTSSSLSSPERVDTNTINGMKGNVIHVPNESAADTLSTMMRGRFVEDKFVYRQNFAIRSYEIGPDKTVTMETLMNFLQDTALNHVPSLGVGGPGNDFGVTLEMSIRNLIWVATRMQVQVQRYSKWGDEIEVDTWFDVAGKNGMRRDWLVRDHCTKEIIARATSTWAILNKETRRLSKMPEEVRQEAVPFNFNRLAIATEETDCEKIHKLTDDSAETIRSGIAPRWSDMDANQHVNNVKYIGWILESVPKEVLKDYNMRSMTLEFRRECTQSNMVESLTSNSAERVIGDSKLGLQYTHLLRLQDDESELVRARTEWFLQQNHN